ncbi:FANCD2 opposite strand protein [Numida meleagris]|uniref:FANCD2 opposite strand protein n=1 Tax=Numida meleagris TaxID=8996 RepID=UPI000B3DBF1E|nr:FANCD2 opposite strand protein [Numida meleagris]
MLRPAPGAMADGYQLWGPSPLDEALRWLRGTPPPPPPPASSAHFFRWASLQASVGGWQGRGGALPRPQAVRLQGVDAVFERLVTAQPPRRRGTLRVSERSAFCRVVAPGRWRAAGLREAEARVAAAMCQQMMRAILLLYAAFKKCAFVLQHAR